MLLLEWSVGATVGVALLWLSLFRPRFLLYCILILLPTQFFFFPVGSFFLSPADVLVTTAGIGFVTRLMLGDTAAWQALWRYRWLLAMVGGFLVGFWITGETSRTLVRLPLAFIPALLASAHLRTERSLRTALVCLVVTGAADAAYGAATYLGGVSTWGGRFSAIAGINFDAMVILAAATIAWSLWATLRGLFLAALLTVAGVATLSRGGVLAFGSGFLLAVRPVLKRRAKGIAFAMILAGVVMAVSVDQIRGAIAERLQSRSADWAGSRSSVEVRGFVSRAALRAFTSHVWTGLGYGGFLAYSLEDPDIAEVSGGEGVFTHDTPLQVLAEGGILAVVPFSLYCAQMAVTTRHLIRRARLFRDRVAAGAAGALIVVVVSGLFADVLLHYSAWAVCGVALACRAQRERESSPTKAGVDTREAAFTAGEVYGVSGWGSAISPS